MLPAKLCRGDIFDLYSRHGYFQKLHLHMVAGGVAQAGGAFARHCDWLLLPGDLPAIHYGIGGAWLCPWCLHRVGFISPEREHKTLSWRWPSFDFAPSTIEPHRLFHERARKWIVGDGRQYYGRRMKEQGFREPNFKEFLAILVCLAILGLGYALTT